MKLICLCLLSGLLFISCKENTNPSGKLSEETIRRHIISLSSDEFQGRKPFTAGEEKTLSYLQEEIEKIDLSSIMNMFGDNLKKDIVEIIKNN